MIIVHFIMGLMTSS